MTVILALLVGQTWFGKPGDLLMRPGIPDYFLVRQDWAQRDMKLTAEEVRKLQEEASRGFPRPGHPRFDPSLVKYDVMNQVTKQHEKRLIQLSLWQADVFAFSNEWVQSQVGLEPSTRKKVDSACRAFYVWWQSESDRLNKAVPRSPRDISKPAANPFLSPDAMVTLKKQIDLRREIRRMVPPSAHAKLATLRGMAPHTAVAFGFPRSAPSVFVSPVQSLLYNPRVHEELGFSMRQSRLTLEGLRNAKDPGTALARVRDQLSVQQRRRLDQLELQALGARALLYHDVLARLKVDPNRLDTAYLELTNLEKQSMKVQNEEQEAYNEVSRVRSSNPTSAREREEAIRARYMKLRQSIEQQRDRTLLGMLSPEQRKTFQAMMGSPIPGVSLK